MTQSSLLGGFEHLVLLALASFPERAEGMDIYDRLVLTTGRDVSVRALREYRQATDSLWAESRLEELGR